VTQETVDALQEVDRFYKNCQLLFYDIVASIRQKTLRDRMTNLVGPEGYYAVWNTNESEHRSSFAFDHNDRVRFVFMLAKTHDAHIRSGSQGFKAICRELNIDVVFPFLLITGVFEPRSMERFRNDLSLRRHWLESTVLLNVPDTIHLIDPSTYAFDKVLTIISPVGTNVWECEKALFRIQRLFDITNSEGVETAVDELLKL
jgi:hypothetical protein